MTSNDAAFATSIPARTEPVMDTICGILCSVINAPVERSPTTTFMTPFGTADLKVPDLRVFPTQVSFTAGDGVRPGISANVTVTVDSVKGCVAVPVSAVFVEGADRVVYVRSADGEWEARKVRLGLSDASWTQIKEGVALGDVVSLVRPALTR